MLDIHRPDFFVLISPLTYYVIRLHDFNSKFRHRENRATMYMARQGALDGMANRLLLGTSASEVSTLFCNSIHRRYLPCAIYFQDPLLFPHRTKPEKRKRLRRAARQAKELDRRPTIVAFGDADLRPMRGHGPAPVKVKKKKGLLTKVTQ